MCAQHYRRYEIEVWIDLGQPDEKRIRKACGRSQQVMIYSYQQGHHAWWNQQKNKLERFQNLSVIALSPQSVAALGQLAQRAMRLQCTISEGQLWLTNGDLAVDIAPEIWKRAKA